MAIVRLDTYYCKQSSKQLYASNMESMNYINPLPVVRGPQIVTILYSLLEISTKILQYFFYFTIFKMKFL